MTACARKPRVNWRRPAMRRRLSQMRLQGMSVHAIAKACGGSSNAAHKALIFHDLIDPPPGWVLVSSLYPVLEITPRAARRVIARHVSEVKRWGGELMVPEAELDAYLDKRMGINTVPALPPGMCLAADLSREWGVNIGNTHARLQRLGVRPTCYLFKQGALAHVYDPEAIRRATWAAKESA